MRVIVTGSRNWSDEKALRRQVAEVAYDVAVRRSEPLVVVHGGCPAGADAQASRWVADWPATGWQGVTEEVFAADWASYGKAAGPIRNAEMVKAGADLVLAFPLGESKGTNHTIKLAREAGIPVRIFEGS